MAGAMPPTPYPQHPGITGAVKLDAIGRSAAKYHIPVAILWGVYGLETTFGKLVHTSSAGAMGHFQFEPKTAKSYNYPMTNTPTPAQFRAQADGAAHYLSDLYRQYGNNWDTALRHYSGGGYGLDAVKKSFNNNPSVAWSGAPGTNPDDSTPIQQVARGPVGDVASGAFDGVKAIGAFFAALLEHDTWTRVLKVGGGGLLVWMALHEMGMAPNVGKAAVKTAGIVPK